MDNDSEKIIPSSDAPQTFGPWVEEQKKAEEEKENQEKEKEVKDPKETAKNFSLISLVLSGFRIVASFGTYYGSFLNGTGHWTEGRAYGYLTGLVNYPYLCAITILNIIATIKLFKIENKKIGWLIFGAWLGWVAVIILTYLIISFKPPNDS